MDSGTVNGLPDLSLFDTFPKLLQLNARNHPDEVALREKEFGIWHSMTWAEYQTRANLRAGASPARPRPRRRGRADRRQPAGLGLGEIAAHAIGAMSLGIYRDALDDEVAFLITYSGARAVFAEDEEQVDKLLASATASAPSGTSSIATRAACGSTPTRA